MITPLCRYLQLLGIWSVCLVTGSECLLDNKQLQFAIWVLQLLVDWFNLLRWPILDASACAVHMWPSYQRMQSG